MEATFQGESLENEEGFRTKPAKCLHPRSGEKKKTE